jgi:hypothetical protein
MGYPISFRLLLVVIATFVASCSDSGALDERTYTLYRNSVTDSNSRMHVATFDAEEMEEYNRNNCDIAQQLFQSQPGVKTKFWCEKGRFRR